MFVVPPCFRVRDWQLQQHPVNASVDAAATMVYKVPEGAAHMMIILGDPGVRQLPLYCYLWLVSVLL